jgi:hypothetical protein
MGGGGTEPAEKYKYFYAKGNDNRKIRTGFFIYKRITGFLRTGCLGEYLNRREMK